MNRLLFLLAFLIVGSTAQSGEHDGYQTVNPNNSNSASHRVAGYPIHGSGGIESIPPVGRKLLFSIEQESKYRSKIEIENEINKKILEKENKLDSELNCSDVYYIWRSDSEIVCDRHYGWGPAPCANPFNVLFGGSSLKTNQYVSVNVYCLARPFDQQAVVSLKRSCIGKTAKKECFDSNVSASFKNTPLTNRYHLIGD